MSRSMFTRGLRLSPSVRLARRQSAAGKFDTTILSDSDRRTLRSMAEHSGWIERGGLAIREASKYQTGGDVIGRTSWVGQPEWARGFGYGKAEIKAIVEKAIAGKRLGSKQKLLFRGMLEVLAESYR